MPREGDVLPPPDLVPVPASVTSAPAHNVSNLNIVKSSRVQIGPKFTTVTQNVNNEELVKDGCVCSGRGGVRGGRCTVALLISWLLLFAAGLTVYFVFLFSPAPSRIDLELPLSKYLWDLAKNSSPTERAACLATVAVVVACVALVVCLARRPSTDLDSVDEPHHEWNISREMWLAQSFTDESSTEPFEPLMLVVVQHTVSNECRRFIQCAAELRNMQAYFIRSFDYDIPYNFIVGNDGRVYEGRGWGVVGAHTRGYNRCSLGIGFIGDYREELGRYTRVSAEQLQRARQLLAEGVRMGRLRADHLVVGARDLQSSASPGSNLYNALRQWPNYDRRNRFKHLTCEQMHDRYAHERL